ncbi:hypothetical protein [Bosea psychrotolerans]|nr:hypothetical protein [Bosea psychrotolerans]
MAAVLAEISKPPIPEHGDRFKGVVVRTNHDEYAAAHARIPET